jgi:hypothetical protein
MLACRQSGGAMSIDGILIAVVIVLLAWLFVIKW